MPAFGDFLRSFYYSNTYVAPVDLSDKGLSQHMLKATDSAAAETAQRLISATEVQCTLSEPLSYIPEEINKKNETLTRHGFCLLISTPILMIGCSQRELNCRVIEHEELRGWVIKSGARRGPRGQLMMGPMNDRNEVALITEEASLLRIEMASRIAKVAREANIDVVLPRKKLVAYANLDGVTEATKKYCVVCEKLDIPSVEETVENIKGMDRPHQIEVARKISTIVQKAGLVDASFDNIRVTREGQISIIDTEPAGLMVAKKAFGAKGASVEKCARIGLFTLMRQTSKEARGNLVVQFKAMKVEPGLEAFRERVEEDYIKAVSPKLSKWKITLSVISLGLIPLINVVVALVKTVLAKRAYKKLEAFEVSFQSIFSSLEKKTLDEQRRIVRKFRETRTPFAKNCFACIEGVPFLST